MIVETEYSWYLKNAITFYKTQVTNNDNLNYTVPIFYEFQVLDNLCIFILFFKIKILKIK